MKSQVYSIRREALLTILDGLTQSKQLQVRQPREI